MILSATTNASSAGYKNYAYDYVLVANAAWGSYAVMVSYAQPCTGSSVYGQGAFQVTGNGTTQVWLVLDHDTYAPGDTVVATAWYEGQPPIYPINVVFGLYVFDESGNQIYFDWYMYTTTVSTSSTTGSVTTITQSFKYIIPTNARPGPYHAHLVAALGSAPPPSQYPSEAAWQYATGFNVSAPVPEFPHATAALVFIVVLSLILLRRKAHGQT